MAGPETENREFLPLLSSLEIVPPLRFFSPRRENFLGGENFLPGERGVQRRTPTSLFGDSHVALISSLRPERSSGTGREEETVLILLFREQQSPCSQVNPPDLGRADGRPSEAGTFCGDHFKASDKDTATGGRSLRQETPASVGTPGHPIPEFST